MDDKAFAQITQSSYAALQTVREVKLKSKVPGKTYLAFEKNGNFSRAINADLWSPDELNRFPNFQEALTKRDFLDFEATDITKLLYTQAASVFAYIDLWKRSQKTPGTYFEILIHYLFAKILGVTPRKHITISTFDGRESKLPTDLVFDLGQGKSKFHVPVKTSTRERIIQVWAHQRVIDGVHGTGAIKGVPVMFAETKTDSNNHEVIEICLPLQWQLYQRYISQMTRIYYFDLPDAYAELPHAPTPIQVKPIGDFFSEFSSL